MTTTTSNAYKSRYGAKEYHGDRPCIDPLTMAELRFRLYGSQLPNRAGYTTLATLGGGCGGR